MVIDEQDVSARSPWSFYHGSTPARTTAGILVSIPGVGKLTANLMAIDLPELGRLDDKQIASLAGVAPHPDESGKYRGQAREGEQGEWSCLAGQFKSVAGTGSPVRSRD